MDRLKIGIVFGGPAEEHPISVKSAQEIAKNLDPEKYEPLWIGITRAGAWLLCDGPAAGWEKRGRAAIISPDRNVHGVLLSGQQRPEAIRLDLVFPVLHGRFGEDGAIQGLLELSGIPYIGCDIQSSALCMDKSLSNTVVRAAGIATAAYQVFTAEQTPDPHVFHYPVFVKPARSGSSFGVSKVSQAAELPAAITEARRYDSKIVIENAVVGNEVGCAIAGNGADLIVGNVDQITLSHGFFRIHQEDNPESGSDNSTTHVPANISDTSRALVQETAQAVYRALGCRGLARVDMFLTAEGTVVLNEVNTLPGMTSYSRYPRMMSSAGITMKDLIDLLAVLALSEERS